MPGRKISSAAALNESERTLRSELATDVQKLAGEIGERNMSRYPQLLAAADFIEASLAAAGFAPRRDGYELRGRALHNIEVEIRGTSPQVFVVGAHYDSVVVARERMTMEAAWQRCWRWRGGSRGNKPEKHCVSSPS